MKNTIRQNVELLLQKYPALRNDDKILIAYYWKEVDKLDFTNVQNFIIGMVGGKSTPMESITRARRLIQADGLYIPTDPDVIMKRQKRECEMKKAIKQGEVV
jgi:hypothetical protein